MSKQEELVAVFNELKAILKKYEPPFIAKFDLDSKYDLWSVKDIEIAGRKRKEVYFAGLIIQSTYVGFYFMPLYAEEKLEEVFSEKLLATKKGMSCFHIKKPDAQLKKDIVSALKKGFKLYKERGWV